MTLPAENPREVRRYTRQLYLLLVVTLLFLAAFLALANSIELLEDFRMPESVEGEYLLLSAASTLLFWLAASWAWRMVVRDFAGVRISLAHCFGQIALVLVGKYLPGKLWGMAIRIKDLTRQGAGGYQAFVCSYVEQLVSIHAALVLGGIGWLFQAKPPYWEAGVALLVLSPLPVTALHNFLVHFLGILPKRFKRLEAFGAVRIPLSSYLGLFGVYLLEWITVGGVLVGILMTVQSPVLDASQVLFLLSANALAFVAGFIAFFAPGGIGVREGVLVAMLSGSMSLAEAVNIAILYRVWLVLADALAGLFSIGLIMKNEAGSK